MSAHADMFCAVCGQYTKHVYCEALGAWICFECGEQRRPKE